MVFLKNVYTLLALSVIILMYSSSVLTQCFNNRYIDDTYLADDVYDIRISPSLMDCVARCYAHSQCESVGFQPETLECHRHTKNSSLAPNSTLVALPGWIHSDNDAWPESILGPCSGTLCGVSEECMVSRAEVPICHEVTTHSTTLATADFTGLPQCPSPPPLQNANISDGMQVVGSVRTYTCLQGYRDLSSDSVTANTTCLQNLNWSHVDLHCSGPWIRKNTPSSRLREYVQLTTEELRRTYINNSLIFLVKTCHDANFNIDRYHAKAFYSFDRIVIGGKNNSFSTIYGKHCLDVTSPGILSCTEYRPFWIKVNDSTISVGKGFRVGYQQLVSCTGPDLIVTDWSISTYLNNAGSWLLKIRSDV